jgi:SAM-dependent methyltransferase
MKNKDLQQTIDRYNQRLDALGPTDQALGWTRENNQIRLKALVANFWEEIPQSSLLDAGCGFGDLLGILQKENKAPASYIGYDINPRLLEEAQKRYPKGTFLSAPLEEIPKQTQADFVCCSGVFNHKRSDGKEFESIKNALKHLFAICQKGLSVNFLSDKVEYKTDHNHNSNPGQLLEFAFSLTNHVVLRNDYMPFEFTLTLRKDVQIDRERLVFVKP